MAETRTEYMRQWRKANPDRVRTYSRRRKPRTAYKRQWVAAHKEGVLEYQRQYRARQKRRHVRRLWLQHLGECL